MTNKALRALFLYNGIFGLAGALLGPLYAVFAVQFNASVLTVSFTWAAFLLSTVITTAIVAKYGDHVRQKKILLCSGMAIRAIAWSLYVFVSSIEMLIIVQVLIGIGEALGSPAFDSIFAEHLDQNRHIAEYSDWRLIATSVMFIGTLVGGLIVDRFGFTPLFLSMSALAVVSFIGIVIQPREELL